VASGSTIVDPDQHGSRRAETAGIAADPVARLSASLLFYMAMRITVDVAHHSLGVRFGSLADIGTRPSDVRSYPESGHSVRSDTQCGRGHPSVAPQTPLFFFSLSRRGWCRRGW
jgi:hypothetical protein